MSVLFGTNIIALHQGQEFVYCGLALEIPEVSSPCMYHIVEVGHVCDVGGLITTHGC